MTDRRAAPVPPELCSWLESLREPHILCDADYRIRAANAAYREQFGGAGVRVLGRTCFQVSHGIEIPCDQAGESCPLAGARASGRPERVLHLHHTPHGEAYVDIEVTPLRDAQGQPSLFVERIEPLRVASSTPAAQGLIGRSLPFRRMLESVARVGPSNAAVLLLGESGTGKELVAKAVHEASARAERPFVVVDCASLTETLFESELFGHERGAFTGASSGRIGLVESAHLGTLFLDELGDIPLAMQVKLLRLLESGTFRRVGSTELRHVDLRLVSATHRDLQAMIAAGRFREDLYYRLSTFPIRLPPLRERRGDIALLAEGLLERVDPSHRRHLSQRALRRLQAEPFPGNVRELRNVLERAALLADDATIHLADLAAALEDHQQAPARATGQKAGSSHRPARAAGGAATGLPRQTLEARLRQALQTLAEHGGHRTHAARALGISERTLYRQLRQAQAMGLTPER